MKSLSIVLLLATLTALVLGTLFAVSPALAVSQGFEPGADAVAVALQEAAAKIPVAKASSADNASPVTGAEVGTAVQAAPSADLAENPGETLGSVFTVSLEKDTVSIQTAPAELEENSRAVVVAESTPALDSFVATVSSGSADKIAGIYIESVLASAVTGQGGNAAYVTGNDNEVTQFGLAAQYGSRAFLAHNYLVGATFFTIDQGQVITLVYGDGRTEDYRVQAIRSYQALQPNSPQSNFIDLDNGEKLSAVDLFYTIYNSDHPVVLQTCIPNAGVSTWGRLFVIAVPLS